MSPRLSYYGGGHYDSLVGLNHAANCIHDPPGEWERRHIEYSRRINTRGSDDADSGVTLQVAAESDRETTEMEQLEQTLLVRVCVWTCPRRALADGVVSTGLAHGV